MRYELAIFDLDGTLVDTLDDLTDAMNYALGQFNQPPVSRLQCREMIGSGLAMFALKALPEGAKHLQQTLVDTMKARYMQTCLDKTIVYSGILEVLADYKRKGIRLAVVSNKEHNLTVRIVEHYFGKGIFEEITGQKESMKIKPDPEPIRYVVGRMGLGDLSKIVYIGDSDVDVQTACNSKIDFVGVSWGFRSAEQLQQAGAQKIIHHPKTLMEIETL